MQTSCDLSRLGAAWLLVAGAVVGLGGCEPARPPVAAPPAVKEKTPREPAAGAEGAPAAGQPEVEPVRCEGDEVDLNRLFKALGTRKRDELLTRADCFVLASEVGAAASKLPSGVEVELTSTPTKLMNHGVATATLEIRNTGPDTPRKGYPLAFLWGNDAWVGPPNVADAMDKWEFTDNAILGLTDFTFGLFPDAVP